MLCGNVAADCRFIKLALVALFVSVTPVQLTAGPKIGTFYFHTDHLGSSTAISDSAANIIRRISYAPDGSPRIVPNTSSETGQARFTGKSWEPTTGLYYFGARWFDPNLGRFLSPDAAQQSSSPYDYVGAAPLLRVDPDGNHYTDFDSILNEVVTYHGFDRGNAFHCLEAGYWARVQAIEERFHFNRRARELKVQVKGLNRRIRDQKIAVAKEARSAAEEARRSARIVQDQYKDLANLARSVKLSMDTKGARLSFIPSKRFKSAIQGYQRTGRKLPNAWTRVWRDLKDVELKRKSFRGSTWGAQRTILASAVEEFENIRVVINPGELEGPRVLEELRRERRKFHRQYERALANAITIEEEVMPQVDDYIVAQRRRLGLAPE